MKKKIILSSLAFLLANIAYAGGVMSKHDSAMKNMSAEDHSRMLVATRTINVIASDMMRFTPDKWSIKQGEVIKFVVTNSGKMKHEFVIGSLAEMREHKKMMKSMPNMRHDAANAVSLDPGEVKAVIFDFSNSGSFQAACDVSGHFEAGMKVNFEI